MLDNERTETQNLIEQSRAEQSRAEQSRAERLIGLDLFRVFSVLVIFFFHTQHIDCTYGFIQGFIAMGAMFMTAFYMLSGFVLTYTNHNRNLLEVNELKKFLAKRFIGIVPVYWVVAIVYTIYIVAFEDASFFKNIALIPVETLGLQTVFCSLFSETHNGGTWFISCLLFCYVAFPFLQLLMRSMSLKAKYGVYLTITAFLLYSPLIVYLLKLDSIYSNPFFRICEFILGVILCDVWLEIKDSKFYKRVLSRWYVVLASFILLVGGVTVAWNLGISRGNYMLYSWIGIPVFTMVILGLCGMRFNRLKNSKLLKYSVDVSYVFFLAQFFTWPITNTLLSLFGGYENVASPIRTVASLAVCCMLAVLMHELIEKPLIRLFKNKLLGGLF